MGIFLIILLVLAVAAYVVYRVEQHRRDLGYDAVWSIGDGAFWSSMKRTYQPRHKENQ